jgi:hypothetical protein
MKDDMGRLVSIRSQLFKHVGTISLKERKLRFKTWMQIKRQANLTFNPWWVMEDLKSYLNIWNMKYWKLMKVDEIGL